MSLCISPGVLRQCALQSSTRVSSINNRASAGCGTSTVKTDAIKGGPQVRCRDLKTSVQFVMDSLM